MRKILRNNIYCSKNNWLRLGDKPFFNSLFRKRVTPSTLKLSVKRTRKCIFRRLSLWLLIPPFILKEKDLIQPKSTISAWPAHLRIETLIIFKILVIILITWPRELSTTNTNSWNYNVQSKASWRRSSKQTELMNKWESRLLS